MVISMDRWRGTVAVVTGASSGIGASIAEALVRRGLKVAALARRKDRLEELAKKLSNQKGTLYPIKTDVSNEGDILNAFKYIRENLGPVHILINNAAANAIELLSEGNTKVWTETLEVNVIGLCIATREAIQDMRSHKVDGHIIHINSVTGHHVVNFPGLNMYPASKFAVTALAETLRLELNCLKSKIKITSISPGLVNTELCQNDWRFSPEFKQLVEEERIIQPEDVADAVVYALSTPPHVQIQELTITPVRQAF